MIDKYDNGREPIASRAIICRTLGELRHPRARPVLIKAVSSPDAVVKIEAGRALGKVGRAEDATVLCTGHDARQPGGCADRRDRRTGRAQDQRSANPVDARRIDGKRGSGNPACLARRHATSDAKDFGTDPADWRRELKPTLVAAGQPGAAGGAAPATAAATPEVLPAEYGRPDGATTPRGKPMKPTREQRGSAWGCSCVWVEPLVICDTSSGPRLTHLGRAQLCRACFWAGSPGGAPLADEYLGLTRCCTRPGSVGADGALLSFKQKATKGTKNSSSDSHCLRDDRTRLHLFRLPFVTFVGFCSNLPAAAADESPTCQSLSRFPALG